MNNNIPVEKITSKIYFIRGVKVMLDRDLAELYGVDTSQLKRQVRRNYERFPEDFMFELTKEELQNLRCQFGISSWGGTRYSPMAFTQEGIAMLSSVLTSKKAIEVNIQIMRTFTQLQNTLISTESLKEKIDKIEEVMVLKFQMIDDDIQDIFISLQELLVHKPEQIEHIGFKVDKAK